MSEPRDLTIVTEAARALAEAQTFDEIKHIVDLADAARLYAKKARLGLDAQNSAAEIRLEAMAKAGELLKKMREQGERATRGRPENVPSGDIFSDETQEPPATLEDLGIDRHESSRYQAVAAIPPKVRAEYVATATVNEQEVTRAGLTKFAHDAVPKRATDMPMTDVHRRKFPAVAAADLSAELTSAIAKVRTDLLDPDKWTDRIGQMSTQDIEALQLSVRHYRRWVDKWEQLLERPALRVVGGNR